MTSTSVLQIGMIHYHDIEIGPSTQMLKGRLHFFQEMLHFELVDKAFTDIKGIKEWQGFFSSNDTNPPLLHEDVFARIQAGTFYSSVDSSTDVTRFFMMQYELPITFHDAQALASSYAVRISGYNEAIEGLRSAHLPVLYDEKGLVSSPTAGARRTSATDQTTEGLHVFYLPPSSEAEEGKELLQAAGKMFTHIHGGTYTISVLPVRKEV
ncbi:hypothetical protein [Shouchella shacheensis]|uniref:hypothetical protein n=1 Tax=Shouchella shacheensis TaxID=1649580 RepID=UPI00073FCD02|nr:hypothetical protein [Shouchella shacheensis]